MYSPATFAVVFFPKSAFITPFFSQVEAIALPRASPFFLKNLPFVLENWGKVGKQVRYA